MNRRHRHNQTGTATAELAMVLPVLLLFSIGAAEAGFAIRSYMACQSAAYRAARAAAVGEPTQLIIARAKDGLPPQMAQAVQISLHKRDYWLGLPPGAWQPLGDKLVGSRLYNDAEVGQHVRATISYAHPLLTPFGQFLDPDRDGSVLITAIAFAEREKEE